MIQHVTWEVRPDSIEACADFYGLLGFRRVAPPDTLADRVVWLERDGTQFHLLKVDEPETLVVGHAAVVAGDYEAALAALRDAGHEPRPAREHWGSPRAFVHDPAGNLVEVMAFPPPPSKS